MGILSPQDAKHHPDANVVTRALGYGKPSDDGQGLEPEVRPEPLSLAKGDSLILCSDGLYDLVSDEEIARAVGGRTAAEATQVPPRKGPSRRPRPGPRDPMEVGSPTGAPPTAQRRKPPWSRRPTTW